jgi:hypothetical protein
VPGGKITGAKALFRFPSYRMCRFVLVVRALCVVTWLTIAIALVISICTRDVTHRIVPTPTSASTHGNGGRSPRLSFASTLSAFTATMLAASPLPHVLTTLSLTAATFSSFGIDATGELPVFRATLPRQHARRAGSVALAKCKQGQDLPSSWGDRGMGVTNLSGPPSAATVPPALFVCCQNCAWGGP